MANILFLGGGRRVTLAEEFIKHGHKIFSYEISEKIPISSISTVINGLEWDDSEIIEHINYICTNNLIDLIIPFQDEAVELVAKKYNKLNTTVIVGKESSATISLDKLLYSNFIKDNFEKYYIPTRLVTLNYLQDFMSLGGDCIIKPRRGFRSLNIHKVSSLAELFTLLSPTYPNAINKIIMSGDYIIQKFIHGQEYTVDGYIDSESNFIDAIPRARLRVDGGEVVTSKTIDYPELVEITKNIGLQLGIIGPYNVQFIIDNNNIYTTETNARFGGGCTLSLKAGLDFISLIEKDYFHVKYNYSFNSWKKNLLMERAYRDYYFIEE